MIEGREKDILQTKSMIGKKYIDDKLSFSESSSSGAGETSR
jgi:hypothetical protein